MQCDVRDTVQISSISHHPEYFHLFLKLNRDFLLLTLSIGCLISFIKIDGSRASRPNVNEEAATRTLSCSTCVLVDSMKVFAIDGMNF